VRPAQPIQFAGSVLDAQRHVCAFFHDPDEEYRVLLPFIKEGFEGGEKAFHIVDPKLRSEHRLWLASAEKRRRQKIRREVDVHVVVLDDNGNGQYGPRDKEEMYPAAALTSTGSINGHPVRCISPECMVKFHSGYKLKEKDFRDVSVLCKKFGIPLPECIIKFNK
jgi:MEDS: MEthanogen/methylotroph, DcmR Sensory domain